MILSILRRRPHPLLLGGPLVVLGLTGCLDRALVGGDAGDDVGDATDTSTTTGTTTGPLTSAGSSPTTTAPTSTSTTSTTGGDTEDSDTVDPTECAFICPPDGGIFDPCDIFTQDCAAGEKCVPWANDGGNSYNSARCVQVQANPQGIYQRCAVQSAPLSGNDDCDFGLACLFVDPFTLEGVCLPMCTGSASDPMCPGNDYCVIFGEPYPAVCIEACDPVAQDCVSVGLDCHPSGDRFLCVADDPLANGMQGDPCALDTQCDPGFACRDVAEVPGCLGSGCCTGLCDLGSQLPNLGCPMSTTCTPYFDPFPPAPGAEHVGACIIP